MNRKNYPDQLFHEQIEKMTFPDLEYFIEELSDDMKANRKKIDACLSQRKNVLRNMFDSTPENVERLYCIAILFSADVQNKTFLDNTFPHRQTSDMAMATMRIWTQRVFYYF